MITAEIKNVVREGNSITVFAQFPEEVRNYKFEDSVLNKEIIAKIKQDVDFINELEAKAEVLKDELIGQIIE